MKALLIVAHGSRREESNEEVRRLAKRIEESSGPAFDRVEHAFLEISGPRVDAALDGLVAEGAESIAVFPYFLSAGTHVAQDIPRLIQETQAAHTGVDFDILPHLGAMQGISSLILSHIYKTNRLPLEPERMETD